MNQCDGCMAGHPLNARGHHIPPHKKGEYANGMVCQKHKYLQGYIPPSECPLCEGFAHIVGPCGYHSRWPTPEAYLAG